MSDFLKSLVARQLGEAAVVRPRLSGRFEPPPDAFAHEAPRRASEFDEPNADANAFGLFLEVETHAAPARDAAPSPLINRDSRAPAPRRETDEPPPRVVFVKEPRDESQFTSRPERSPAQTSERTHDAPLQVRESRRDDAHDAPSTADASDSHARTRTREESDAHVRPKSVVPSFKEDAARASDERASAARPPAASDVDEEKPVRPVSTARDPDDLSTRARTHGDRRTPSQLEPREPSGREVNEARHPSSDVRPSQAPAPVRPEARVVHRASDESSMLTRTEPARTREAARSRDDEAESNAGRHTRRGGQESAAFEPPPSRRVARQAAARDASRARAEVAPIINVTIGRVEVRATQAQPSAPRRTEAVAPRMSLDDYLRRRSGEVRE
jgi:hypothetical protein